MWIPRVWQTYIIECIIWIPCLLETYAIDEECIMWILGV